MAKGAALALALMLVPGLALAGGHARIESHAIVQFEAGKITALHMGWKLAAEDSARLLRHVDVDGDGTLSAGELQALEREAFQDTAKAGYLTYAWVDGVPVSWAAAEDFKPVVFRDSLVYSFRLQLPQPVDPRAQAFRLSTYGEAHHIDIDFPNDTAVKLVGDGAAGCQAHLAPDLENRLYGGVVVPDKVEIVCE